jgi:hypothetical protein
LAAETTPRLVFDAVEPNETYRTALRELAARVSAGAVRLRAVYASVKEMPAEAQYDLVLLHNVIHEVAAGDMAAVVHAAIQHVSRAGAINVLEQAVLLHGEHAYFVFSAQALAGVFTATGHHVTLSTRNARSGIPVYEITATRNVEGRGAIEDVRSALLGAVEATINEDIDRFEAPVEPRTTTKSVPPDSCPQNALKRRRIASSENAWRAYSPAEASNSRPHRKSSSRSKPL